jgi:hypothetical protein
MATPATPGYMRKIQPLTERKSWTALQAHYQEIHGQHLKELFAADPQRGERMTAEAVGIFLDYSKNRITDKTVKLLIQLAEESGGKSIHLISGEWNSARFWLSSLSRKSRAKLSRRLGMTVRRIT